MFRDGPLTRRAPETIRYGTGRCALGALLVASSERGIVSIMVRDTEPRLIRDLGARLSEGEDRPGRNRQQAHGRAGCAVHRGAVSPFRTTTGYPRHGPAAAHLGRGAQD